MIADRFPRRLLCVLTLLLWPIFVFAASPFELQLSDLSRTWFPEGAIVHVPRQRCLELQVRLQKPWSTDVGIDLLELKLDGVYPRFTRLTGGEGHLLNVRTREPAGLLTRDNHSIQASSGARSALRSDWTILRWDQAYIKSVSVSATGIPIQVEMDQPKGGVVSVSPKGRSRIHMRLTGADNLRLRVNGEEMPRMLGKPGYEFDQEITIADDAKDVTVRAEDDTGDVTILVLPVIR